jgi:hypothetical protein
MIPCFLAFLVTFNECNPHDKLHSSTTVSFLKPKANIMRRVNPLKLLFTVVHTPQGTPQYAVEWNLDVLKTILLESSHVTDEDKALFIMEFSNHEQDYAHWSEEKHDQLERLTEKYFNLYKSPETFLPFNDCPVLTYALMDEMINDLQPTADERKRTEIRARAATRLCNAE